MFGWWNILVLVFVFASVLACGFALRDSPTVSTRKATLFDRRGVILTFLRPRFRRTVSRIRSSCRWESHGPRLQTETFKPLFPPSLQYRVHPQQPPSCKSGKEAMALASLLHSRRGGSIFSSLLIVANKNINPGRPRVD
ncbi:hypothetical protein BJX65DRAFT_287923 [Aspergillus insuetus]